MIDFHKKIKNTNKFRKPAISYLETGSYCSYPKGTSEYFNFWEQEMKYCIEGYTAEDGDYITGYNYFYLNYCPIQRIVYKKVTNKYGKEELKKTRETAFPDFYDYDYYYFRAIQEAEEQGKHMVVAKARRKGYSYKGGSMLCRNFFLIPNSKSYVYASNKQYLTDDGILTKAWDYMDFVDSNTAWGKKRQVANTSMRRRASMLITDEYGNKIEVGYKSEIIGVSLKDNPDSVRGKAGKLILWEEAGTFPELEAAWQIARPSVEQDGVAFGLMIAFGTGGDQGDAVAPLRSAFYDPKSFNCLGFENIWDEGNQDRQCGFFVPQHTNLDIRDENGNRLYMDKDGNTLHEKARQFILNLREEELKSAKSSQQIDRYVAEHSESPAEAFTELSGNIFPKKALQMQLSRVRTNKKLTNAKQVGFLTEVKGELIWNIQKKPNDITEYPLPKTADPTGAVVIWEHPLKEAPYGLYIAGCLTPGEKVMTDKGLMNVEDVGFDKKLINKEGDLVNINTLLRYNKVNEDIYKVKVSNTYRTTTFTAEHPIYTSQHNLSKVNTIDESNFNFQFNRMRNVKVTDWIKVPNIYRNYKDCYSKEFIHDASFFFFIGTWLGDGWCNKDGRISVVFNKTERIFQLQYIDLICSLFDRKCYSRTRNNAVEITFNHKSLAEYLTNNFGRHAHGKYIPEWVKYENWHKKIQLIAGYLNTDGCITKDKRGYYSIEFVSVNLELLESIQDIMFSLGYVGNLTKMRNKGFTTIAGKFSMQKECYHLRFGHNDVISFARETEGEYNDLFTKLCKVDLNNYKITRTRPKSGCFLSRDKTHIYFQIKSIEQSKYTGIVYNFDCETHTFMCHHITTHNCDPYDQDQSGTNSLGSCIIYKRFQNFESNQDIIVAEYTGRPKTAEEFYDNVRKLLKYYNAKAMVENQNTGIFTYFNNKHCSYLLADQPDVIRDITNSSKVNRGKGCHMTKEIKAWGIDKIKEYLEEDIGNNQLRLETILSEPLLEELIKYNDKANADRVMALLQIMIYREQMYNIQVKKVEETEKKIRLFDKPIFKFSKDTYEPQLNNSFSTTTFMYTN